jgi:hypothetical protein
MAAKKSAATTLSEAQAELVNINARLSDSSARRDQLLLQQADDKTLDAIEAEVANLQRQHERQVARIRLLEEQARAEEADAVAARRRSHIAKFEKKLADADLVADELQSTLEQADKLFRKIITLREDALILFWGSTSHENALAVSSDGCAMSGIAVKALIMHEIFRCGARPFVGGKIGEIKQVDFPGGQCPRHEWLGQPDKIEPLGARMRRASQAAIDVMNGKISGGAIPDTVEEVATPPSGNGTQPSTSPPAPRNGVETNQDRISALLREQARLAEDMTPAGEAAYQEVVRQLAALS